MAALPTRIGLTKLSTMASLALRYCALFDDYDKEFYNKTRPVPIYSGSIA